MSNGRITIYRGQDKLFNIKLRKSNGDPLSLVDVTNLEIKFKKSNKQTLTLSLDEVAAVRATASYSEVDFSADTIGAIGNLIILQFDNVHTIDEIVTTWNDANPSNTVSHNGEGSTVFPVTTVDLSGGQDAYYPVNITNDVLGFVQVKISNNETQSLRHGEDQDIDFIIDYGEHVGGTRYITKLRGKLDVYKIS